LTEALLLSALGAVTGALGAVVTAVRATRQGARSSCPEAVGVGIAASVWRPRARGIGRRVPRIGDNGRQGLGLPGRLAVDAAGYGLGALLAGIAAARGGKAVHPSGVVYGARLVVDGAADAPRGSQLLGTPAEHTALMRFSRSLGMPRPFPDLLGVSLRVLDAYGPGRHQDFMLVSSVDLPVLHHIFVPAADAQQRPYSSSLPYRARDATFLVGVVPDARSPRPSGDDEFQRLAAAAATGRLTFGLATAPIGGRFRRVGTLHVEQRLPQTHDALRFSPFNCGGGLAPVGVLNRLRDYAYPLSQAAWGRRGDGARAQAQADAQLRRLAAERDNSRPLR
jgi:hypothetical protein